MNVKVNITTPQRTEYWCFDVLRFMNSFVLECTINQFETVKQRNIKDVRDYIYILRGCKKAYVLRTTKSTTPKLMHERTFRLCLVIICCGILKYIVDTEDCREPYQQNSAEKAERRMIFRQYQKKANRSIITKISE